MTRRVHDVVLPRFKFSISNLLENTFLRRKRLMGTLRNTPCFLKIDCVRREELKERTHSEHFYFYRANGLRLTEYYFLPVST